MRLSYCGMGAVASLPSSSSHLLWLLPLALEVLLWSKSIKGSERQRCCFGYIFFATLVLQRQFIWRAFVATNLNLTAYCHEATTIGH